jgi:hypothetical protein
MVNNEPDCAEISTGRAEARSGRSEPGRAHMTDRPGMGGMNKAHLFSGLRSFLPIQKLQKYANKNTFDPPLPNWLTQLTSGYLQMIHCVIHDFSPVGHSYIIRIRLNHIKT